MESGSPGAGAPDATGNELGRAVAARLSPARNRATRPHRAPVGRLAGAAAGFSLRVGRPLSVRHAIDGGGHVARVASARGLPVASPLPAPLAAWWRFANQPAAVAVPEARRRTPGRPDLPPRGLPRVVTAGGRSRMGIGTGPAGAQERLAPAAITPRRDPDVAAVGAILTTRETRWNDETPRAPNGGRPNLPGTPPGAARALAAPGDRPASPPQRASLSRRASPAGRGPAGAPASAGTTRTGAARVAPPAVSGVATATATLRRTANPHAPSGPSPLSGRRLGSDPRRTRPEPSARRSPPQAGRAPSAPAARTLARTERPPASRDSGEAGRTAGLREASSRSLARLVNLPSAPDAGRADASLVPETAGGNRVSPPPPSSSSSSSRAAVMRVPALLPTSGRLSARAHARAADATGTSAPLRRALSSDALGHDARAELAPGRAETLGVATRWQASESASGEQNGAALRRGLLPSAPPAARGGWARTEERRAPAPLGTHAPRALGAVVGPRAASRPAEVARARRTLNPASSARGAGDVAAAVSSGEWRVLSAGRGGGIRRAALAARTRPGDTLATAVGLLASALGAATRTAASGPIAVPSGRRAAGAGGAHSPASSVVGATAVQRLPTAPPPAAAGIRARAAAGQESTAAGQESTAVGREEEGAAARWRRGPLRPVARRFLDALAARRADPPSPVPAHLRPLARVIAGPGPLEVRAGAASRAALAAVGKPAATVGRVIHLAAPPDRSPVATEILAHEMVHAARRSAAPRFFGDHPSTEEHLATEVGALARSLVLRDAPHAPEGLAGLRVGTSGLAVGSSFLAGAGAATQAHRRSAPVAPPAPEPFGVPRSSGTASAPGAPVSAELRRLFNERIRPGTPGASDAGPSARVHRMFDPGSSTMPSFSESSSTTTGVGRPRSGARIGAHREQRPHLEPDVAASRTDPLPPETLEWIIEKIEQRVIDELERRGLRHNPGVF